MQMNRMSLSIALACLPSTSGRTALLVIDVQDCFLEADTTSGEAGTLAVPASQIIPKINQMRSEKSCLFDEVIFSQDYHPANHISFGSSHGLDPFAHLGGLGSLPLKCITPSDGSTAADAACCPGFYIDPTAYDCSTQLCPPENHYAAHPEVITDNPACTECANNPGNCFDMEQAMWTDHCLQNGDSTFPPSLTKNADDLVVQKGGNQYVDAYSAFMDNTQTYSTPLDAELQARNIDTLYVVGIATDVCVHATVADALGANTEGTYTVTVVTDATAAVQGDQTNFDASVATMQELGANVLTTTEVLAMSCPASGSGSGAASGEGESDASSAFKASALFGLMAALSTVIN